MSAFLDGFALLAAGERVPHDGTTRVCGYETYKKTGAGEEAYVLFCDEAVANKETRLFVPSLDLPDAALDTLIDHALDTNARLAVRCAVTLYEVGAADKRFRKSPVMALHAFGLLGQSTIVSGVYLDKEDLALMRQENVPLVVLPSADAGAGNGVAPVLAACAAGVTVRIGTGDGRYNPSRSVAKEARLLQLLVSAQMNKGDALSPSVLAAICAKEGATKVELAAIANEIENT